MDKNRVVRVANARLRALWHAESVWQGRLLALMACQISGSDEDFTEYVVPFRDIMGPSRSVSAPKKQEIVECLKKLMRTPITIPHDGGNVVEIMCMLSYVRIDFGAQTVSATFDPHLKPFYLELKRRYTTYSVDEYIGLRSTYSQKLYEYLMSWRDKNMVLVELEELHRLLDVPPSAKAAFTQFRIRILNKSLEEIKQKTSLNISYETLSHGRKVMGLKFYFNRQPSVSSEDTKKVAKKNNSLFMKAFRCAQQHLDIECAGNNSKQCELCVKLKMKTQHPQCNQT